MAIAAFQRDPDEGQALPGRVTRLRSKAVPAGPRKWFVERYDLLDEAYRQHKDEPYAIRHAHITNHILSGISIVVDVGTLIDAKAHPEEHGSLVVRATGYSVRFVDLGPQLQDIIIARTAHEAH